MLAGIGSQFNSLADGVEKKIHVCRCEIGIPCVVSFYWIEIGFHKHVKIAQDSQIPNSHCEFIMQTSMRTLEGVPEYSLVHVRLLYLIQDSIRKASTFTESQLWVFPKLCNVTIYFVVWLQCYKHWYDGITFRMQPRVQYHFHHVSKYLVMLRHFGNTHNSELYITGRNTWAWKNMDKDKHELVRYVYQPSLW